MSKTIQTKRCPTCKQIFPITTKYFYKHKSAKNGFRCYCKQCSNKSHRKYQQFHREKLRYIDQKYYKTLRGHLNRLWHRMLRRCNNPKHKQYKDWGGRGIKIKFACFEDFFYYIIKELKADPRGLTIDRINNNGHYEKGNIRFVSQADNNRNK